MNKFFLTLLVFSALSFNLFAQNPGFTRTDPEWIPFPVDSVEAKSHAIVNNPYGATEEFRIILVSSNLPTSWWGVGICDINLCYGTGEDTAIASYPPGNSTIYIYYSKEPDSTGGGTSTWRVERVSNPSQRSADVTFGATSFPIGITNISSVAKEFSLSQNYPNPFNPNTKINFSIPKGDYVSLRVFDMLGREVAVLVNGQLTAGEYQADFSAKGLSSGMYYYSLRSGDYVDVKKMVLVK